MHPIDLVIIFLYVAGVLIAGAWFGRRQRSTAHYFFATQHVPWWAVGASIVATETSTISFISVPGIAYARGGNFTFLQLVFGYLVGRVIISFLFIPSYFKGKLTTVYELLHGRFGQAVTSLSAALFVIMRSIADGVRLLLTAIVLAGVYRTFVPSANMTSALTGSILALGVVMVVLFYLGGMEAIIWVEFVQLFIYIGGAIAAGVVLVHGIPGGLGAALDIGHQYGKFQLLDFSASLTRSFTFWAGVIGGCFLTMSTHGTDQFMVQRYLSTAGPRPAAAGLLTSAVVVLVQFIGFLFLGVLLFAWYAPYKLATWATGSPAAPFISPDQVFPNFITHHLPTGLSGLVVAAILAAAMSSSINSIAATAMSDLYRPIFRGRSDRHYLNVSKVLTIVAGIVQIGVALGMAGMTRSALDTALSVASLINGPVLGVFLLGAAKRGRTTAALSGMTAGIIAVAVVWLGTPLAWPWYTVVGSVTTFAVGLFVSLVKGETASEIALGTGEAE